MGRLRSAKGSVRHGQWRQVAHRIRPPFKGATPHQKNSTWLRRGPFGKKSDFPPKFARSRGGLFRPKGGQKSSTQPKYQNKPIQIRPILQSFFSFEPTCNCSSNQAKTKSAISIMTAPPCFKRTCKSKVCGAFGISRRAFRSCAILIRRASASV